MNENQLPQEVLRQIKEEIIEFAETDLTRELKFAPGYIVLGKDNLYVFYSTKPGVRISFKGFKREHIPSEFEFYKIPVEGKVRLEVIKTVNGGILAVLEEEKEKAAAWFTNNKVAEVSHLAESFNRLTGSTQDQKPWEEQGGSVPGPGPRPGHGPGGPGGPGRKHQEEICPKCGSIYPDPDRKICPKCMDKRSVFIKTLRYFKPHRAKLILLMASFLAVAGLNLVWPYLNGVVLYDRVLSKNEAFLKFLGLPAGRFVTALGLVVLTMVVTKALMQAIGILQGVITAKIVPDVVSRIKSDVFASMGRLSVNFFISRQTGSLMTRIVSDAERVTGLYLDSLPYNIINSVTVIMTAAVLIALNPIMGICAIVFMPLLVWFSFKMLPRQWNLFGRIHRAERRLNSQIHDNLIGARVVKSFGQQKNETKRFDRYNQNQKKAELSIVSFDNLFYTAYNGAKSLISLLVIAIGSYFIISGISMELGTLITFIGYVEQLNGPLDNLSRFFRQWAESMNAAQRLFEIIEAVPDVTEKPNPIILPEVKGEIELRNVSFGYEPNNKVLKNVSLKVPSGGMLGIVGRSGAGKSTLVNLISRLYDPDEGEILLDGVNIKDLSFKQLRSSIAMVSQETYIFIGTVAENIAYAKPDATMDEIVNAAVLAYAHDFICKMPDGYDTVIGASGRSLSGGERQRISIARAILANPKILILDEATSAVDTETEKAIQSSINYLIKGRTTISIAHRLSTLRDADMLAVIDEGRVTEQGTAKELYEKKGTYYKLRQLQTKALALKGLE